MELTNTVIRIARQLQPEQIKPGCFYCNGASGANRCVRQIVDSSPNANPDKDMVVYRVIVGTAPRSSAMLTRSEFARWAACEVTPDKDGRVPTDGNTTDPS